MHAKSEINVEAFPQDIPHAIEVDLSPLLEIDDSIYVRDLKVDASKVEILDEGDELIVRVVPVRIEEEARLLPLRRRRGGRRGRGRCRRRGRSAGRRRRREAGCACPWREARCRRGKPGAPAPGGAKPAAAKAPEKRARPERRGEIRRARVRERVVRALQTHQLHLIVGRAFARDLHGAAEAQRVAAEPLRRVVSGLPGGHEEWPVADCARSSSRAA